MEDLDNDPSFEFINTPDIISDGIADCVVKCNKSASSSSIRINSYLPCMKRSTLELEICKDFIRPDISSAIEVDEKEEPFLVIHNTCQTESHSDYDPPDSMPDIVISSTSKAQNLPDIIPAPQQFGDGISRASASKSQSFVSDSKNLEISAVSHCLEPNASNTTYLPTIHSELLEQAVVPVQSKPIYTFSKLSTVLWKACPESLEDTNYSTGNVLTKSITCEALDSAACDENMFPSISVQNPSEIFQPMMFESVTSLQTRSTNKVGKTYLGRSSCSSVTTGDPLRSTKLSSGMWDWFRKNEFFQKIADKAKESFDSMVMTLDPGMKDCIAPEPCIRIVVATHYHAESVAIEEAFRKKFFGKVLIRPIIIKMANVPPQPIGFYSGLHAAEAKVEFIRQQNLVTWDEIIVAISPVLVELTPQRWHDTTCMVLDDPAMHLGLHVFTQTTPVPNDYVIQAQIRTPNSYHLRSLGLSVTVGQVMNLLTGISPNNWHETLSGVSYQKILESGAGTLAGLYRSYLNGMAPNSF